MLYILSFLYLQWMDEDVLQSVERKISFVTDKTVTKNDLKTAVKYKYI